jgi:protein phosphatase 1L
MTCVLLNDAAIAVSRDHKPDQTDERQRIEDAGGFVMWAGTWRVGGVLAVSRAFGDKLLKQYVVADPEIKVCYIDHTCILKTSCFTDCHL